MKNIKGFTTAELLVSILLVAILFSVGAIGVTYCLNQGENTYNDNLSKELKLMAKSYYVDNKNKMLKSNNIITYSELKSNNYVTNDLKDYEGNDCSKSYVIVEKSPNNSYNYLSCIICDNGYTNINNNISCSF